MEFRKYRLYETARKKPTSGCIVVLPLNWTVFCFFQKGTALLYGGQEAGCVHLPSLFDKDTVDWSGPDYSGLICRLCALKKHPVLTDSSYQVEALPGDMLRAVHWGEERRLVGLFSVKGKKGLVPVDLPDGWYENLADGGRTEVKHGLVSCCGLPIVVEAPGR